MMAPLLSVEVDAGAAVDEGGTVVCPSVSEGVRVLAASSRAKVSLKVSAAVTFRKAQEGMSVLTVDREPGKLTVTVEQFLVCPLQ